MTSHDEYEKIYRPSATIIISAKTDSKELGYNYRILLAKRTYKTAFAPDHHVFPGGVFDAKADENPQWLDLFKENGVTEKELQKLCLEHLPNRPRPLMTNKKFMSRDISLRITAIREAFEEVGVLLCITKKQFATGNPGYGQFRDNFDKSHWQQRVHNNSMEFLNLCKYLKVIPDLWSLHEWSIWRSPPAALKKYDTVLYFVALDRLPQLLLEPSEVEKELWASPSFALKLYRERKIWLPPLQFYEISRLTNILNWSELKKFVKNRSTKGSTLLVLAYYRCNDDVLVGTLPNDDFYPKEPIDNRETVQLEEDPTQFHARAKNLHRLVYKDMYDLAIICNIPGLDGHLSPMNQGLEEEKSKL
ncbi:acyl-coenzyme A diphosphatase NUDT19 [Musca vetustissima]|uniref:acyl-coenzyme A diphosphatase NUDT19 n=1 Tax=Musca vetustissima TaxID=27455 RepID=UPI002AB62207|nr:acyl-coenzyme A diphosphatase NUDT19 [Musca vetustissima]